MDDSLLAGNISQANAPGPPDDSAGDDGMERVPIPGQGGAAPAEDRPAVSINLVGVFQPPELAKIAMRVVDDYDEDLGSRDEHMRRLKRWYELYAGVLKVKNWPFQNAANVNVPLLTYVILQVHGRLFDMLLPAKGDVFHSVPTRATDPGEVDRAERTELFYNWYVRDKIPEYRMSYDATLWQLLTFGSAFRYSYWDETEGRLCAEWVGIEDMVIPYKCKVTDPTMRGVPRYTLCRWSTLFAVQEKGDSGELANTDRLKPVSSSKDKQSEFKEAVREVDGVDPPMERRFLEDEDRLLLEQHRWLRLPDDRARHPSFDGKPHPVIVVVDESTRTVLRIVLREEDDPSDARKAQQEQQAAMLQPQLPGAAPQPPPPLRAVRKREVCFFTHYQCFQGEGFYGLGFGNFVGSLNEAINTLFNQQIDRATVNNAGGGIISRQVRFQRGPITREPGKYEEVDAPASAMKDALQNWPQVNPDPEGRWFVQMIEEWVGRVSGAGDTLSGEPIGSNETARAAMARYEQAQKQITVLAARVIGYMTCDARRDWRLFSVYLDESEYHNVIDSSGKPRQVQVGRADFVADAKVVPTADARMTSHAQRIDEAQQHLMMVTSPTAPPELGQNPAVRRAAIEGYLYAADRHEEIELLGPPPGPPQPPPPKPQWEENAGFLREQDQPVNPADDDDAHLLEMQMFGEDPLGAQQLSPTAQKMFDNHRRGHLAAKLEKGRKADETRRQAMGAAQGSGPGGMAGPSGQPPPPGLADGAGAGLPQ